MEFKDFLKEDAAYISVDDVIKSVNLTTNYVRLLQPSEVSDIKNRLIALKNQLDSTLAGL